MENSLPLVYQFEESINRYLQAWQSLHDSLPSCWSEGRTWLIGSRLPLLLLLVPSQDSLGLGRCNLVAGWLVFCEVQILHFITVEMMTNEA